MGQSNNSAEEIYIKMKEECPFVIHGMIKPYIIEAMEIHAKSRVTALEEENARLREALKALVSVQNNCPKHKRMRFAENAEQALTPKSESNG